MIVVSKFIAAILPTALVIGASFTAKITSSAQKRSFTISKQVFQNANTLNSFVLQTPLSFPLLFFYHQIIHSRLLGYQQFYQNQLTDSSHTLIHCLTIQSTHINPNLSHSHFANISRVYQYFLDQNQA